MGEERNGEKPAELGSHYSHGVLRPLLYLMSGVWCLMSVFRIESASGG